MDIEQLEHIINYYSEEEQNIALSLVARVVAEMRQEVTATQFLHALNRAVVNNRNYRKERE